MVAVLNFTEMALVGIVIVYIKFHLLWELLIVFLCPVLSFMWLCWRPVKVKTHMTWISYVTICAFVSSSFQQTNCHEHCGRQHSPRQRLRPSAQVAQQRRDIGMMLRRGTRLDMWLLVVGRAPGAHCHGHGFKKNDENPVRSGFDAY
jgi:hypothetical protein